MNTFGPPTLVLVRGEGARRGTTRRQASTSTCSAASRSTRSATPTRRSSRRSPSRSRRSATSRTSSPPSPRCALAERLLDAQRAPAADGRVFFANSGAEANEAAFKLTRRTGRTHVVAAEGAFHGRTMGALALTGAAGQARAVRAAARRRDLRAVRRRRGAGRGRRRPDRRGVPRADPGRGRRGRRRRRLPRRAPGRSPPSTARCSGSTRSRPGIGRTGSWFAHQQPAIVRRDVVTLAKGLGGGFPIGACIGLGDAADAVRSPATTAPPSAATRSPAPPPSPSSTRSRRDGLLEHVTDARRARCATASAADTRVDRGARRRAC